MSSNIKTPFFKYNNGNKMMKVTTSVKNISNKKLIKLNNNELNSSENNFHSSNDSNKFE